MFVVLSVNTTTSPDFRLCHTILRFHLGRNLVWSYLNSRSRGRLIVYPKIYATSEERKQRNRQAQAAFRERRTEYIKQLEEAIRVHESNLHNLQAAHRTAADECLMLRYKNSLLERILLEKGTLTRRQLVENARVLTVH